MSRRKGEIDTHNSKTEYHDEGKQPTKVVHTHISILWLAYKHQQHGHCMKKMPGLHLGNESIGSRWPKTNPERGNVQVPCAPDFFPKNFWVQKKNTKNKLRSQMPIDTCSGIEFLYIKDCSLQDPIISQEDTSDSTSDHCIPW